MRICHMSYGDDFEFLCGRTLARNVLWFHQVDNSTLCEDCKRVRLTHLMGGREQRIYYGLNGLSEYTGHLEWARGKAWTNVNGVAP